jgi:ribA/ribD-fused uncharacterized protein
LAVKVANGFLLFHHKSEIYSNWYLRPFTVKGIIFNCVEQMLMFAKARLFGDEVRAAEIMATHDPAEQKAIGRKVDGFVEAVWVERREAILLHALYAKFTQHEDLKLEMINTGDLEFVEASGSDGVYGVKLWESNPRILDRRNWRGSNILGLALNSVRSKIVAEINAGHPHRRYT